MELVCPVCAKWIEVAERNAVSGGRSRCPECWKLLRVVSVRPLTLRVESRGADRLGEPCEQLTETGGRRA